MNIETYNSETGEYSPAEPLKMTCEYQFCQCTEGQDYIDPNRKGAWKDEPVFLCDKHAELLGLIKS